MRVHLQLGRHDSQEAFYPSHSLTWLGKIPIDQSVTGKVVFLFLSLLWKNPRTNKRPRAQRWICWSISLTSFHLSVLLPFLPPVTPSETETKMSACLLIIHTSVRPSLSVHFPFFPPLCPSPVLSALLKLWAETLPARRVSVSEASEASEASPLRA